MGPGEQYNHEHDYTVKINHVCKSQMVTLRKSWLLGLGDYLWHFFSEENIFSCAKLVILWMLEKNLGWRVGFAIFAESMLLYFYQFFPARIDWCIWSEAEVGITSGDLTRRAASHACLNLIITIQMRDVLY